MPPEPAWGWRDSDPVVNVSWQDASDYASYVNAALPTEAQWEKAARGTDGRQYPWGDTWQPERCVSALQTGQHTMPVGSFPTNASPCGCVDMAGNVWQWCADVFDSKYYAISPAANPTGPTSGSNHVLRGGGWVNVKPKTFRSAYRNYDGEDNYDDSYGFRCVISAP
jgi:formylglycine-generating enzyme required for sulfatase activity